MARLWTRNARYLDFKPQSLSNMPYKRLYKTLNPDDALELIMDARLLDWEFLDLHSCGLSVLPEALWTLSNLRVLCIGNALSPLAGEDNSVTRLPEGVGRLTNLESLDLSCSYIDTLPDSLLRLTNLKSLDLSGCHLKSIPHSVVRLGLPFITANFGAKNGVNLTGVTLDEGDAHLFALPRPSIEAHYRKMALSNAPAAPSASKTVEELIQDAKRLHWKVLDLRGRPLETLPDSIGYLNDLRSLNLSRTNIAALPDSIKNLIHLRLLDLSGSKLRVLPDAIGKMTDLQSLNLSGTQIRELPDSIGDLPNLKTLDLRRCHLKSIPYGVIRLRLPFVLNDDSYRNNCVNLTGATLDEGDLRLFAQSLEAIENYYRTRTQKRYVLEIRNRGFQTLFLLIALLLALAVLAAVWLTTR